MPLSRAPGGFLVTCMCSTGTTLVCGSIPTTPNDLTAAEAECYLQSWDTIWGERQHQAPVLGGVWCVLHLRASLVVAGDQPRAQVVIVT
jgi:hypothetical protein